MNETYPSGEDLDTFLYTAPSPSKGQPIRKLEEELYKKNWPKEAIDSLESRLGIRPKADTTQKNTAIKNKLFRLEYENEAVLLNELMNSPKYRILYWKDNWTVDGQYRVFAIYSDDLDFKQEKKNEQDLRS